MPILCNYYVTYRCNAYCAFCHFGDHSSFKSSQHARTADVLTNLPALRSLGVRFIDLTGGEPLLHPDIDVIAKAAKTHGMRTSITTNGLLYPKFAERLRGNVDLLHFSLDSAERDQHDSMRGIPCFDRVMESIALARSLGEQPDLLFTVTEENYGQVEHVHAIAQREGLMLLLNPVFRYFREEGLSETALASIEQFARGNSRVYLNPSFITLRRRGGNDVANPLCRAVSRVVVISPDNELLLPCYHLHVERIPIAGNLPSLWNGDRVQWHRAREGRHAFCHGCTINCYFEPSFAFPVNPLSIAAVPSKLRYGVQKFILQPMRKK